MSWSRYDSYFGSGEHALAQLVGKTVQEIHWSEDKVVFKTDDGDFAYEVEGDCCSTSYFHDFFGVEHLLNNGPVTEVADVELADDDPRFSHPVGERPEGLTKDDDDYWRYYDDSIAVYGYRLTTVHPVFGEVSSVLSFRNASNGYYGGWMDRTEDTSISTDYKQLTEDFIGS